MNIEGRKFHFARDEDGRIYAENEIETEIANREGWLLPPRKGEQIAEYYIMSHSIQELKVVYETTGELIDSFPAYTVVSAQLVPQNCSDRRID